MTSSVGLVLHGIGHAYQGLVVLDRIDLTIPPGEVAVVIGPSGCGKSTLLSIIGGLLRPTAGRVTMRGAVAADCLNALTYVFQDFALLPWRSVAGNVSLVLEDTRLSHAERAGRVAEVLELTGLSAFRDALPKQLSGGMRQRVGIARALAVRPAVLLMDEPLSALDAQTRDLLLDEFAATIARAGVTAVYVTHNLAEAVRLGQQIVVLSRRPGRIREIIRIPEPVGRRDPARMRAIEAQLWAAMRDEAAVAVRELEHG
ncbi:MAG TPA: ABC transporter ATP-binding protein [Acetobacteraceae bacterium]